MDVVFTNLPDIPDVVKVALGEDGIIDGAHPGLIFVDNSTIKPAAARTSHPGLGENGVACLDAPVSGGDIGARNGTLTIMVGGPTEALEKVLPVFQAMGKTVTHVGESAPGQIAKAANQIMVAAQMVAMGELLIFSQKAGADPRKVVEAIRGGAAQCWTLDVKPPRLFEGNRNPGFKAYMQVERPGYCHGNCPNLWYSPAEYGHNQPAFRPWWILDRANWITRVSFRSSRLLAGEKLAV